MQNLPLLSAGKDPLLLSTRNQVLSAAGFTILPAASVNEALLTIARAKLSAVVLCHTFTPAERDQIRSAVTRLQPTVPVMVVCCGDYDTGYDEVLIENDPRTLVNTVTATAKAMTGLH